MSEKFHEKDCIFTPPGKKSKKGVRGVRSQEQTRPTDTPDALSGAPAHTGGVPEMQRPEQLPGEVFQDHHGCGHACGSRYYRGNHRRSRWRGQLRVRIQKRSEFAPGPRRRGTEPEREVEVQDMRSVPRLHTTSCIETGVHHRYAITLVEKHRALVGANGRPDFETDLLTEHPTRHVMDAGIGPKPHNIPQHRHGAKVGVVTTLTELEDVV